MRPQAISFHFNDHNVHDHARLCRGLGEIARAGFRTVLGYRRGTSLLIDDPEFVAAVAAGAAECRRLGLALLLQLEPGGLGLSVNTRAAAKHPDSVQVQLVRGSAPIVNGAFRVPFRHAMIHNSLMGFPTFTGVAAAFLRDAAGVRRIEGLDFHADYVMDVYGGMYERENRRQHGRRPEGWPNPAWTAEGTTDLAGELILYASFRMCDRSDFASPGLRDELARCLEVYRDVPLGGVFWDEPQGGAGEWGTVKWGVGFAEVFRRVHGGDPLDGIWMLDEEGDPRRTARIRHDYHRAMTEAAFGVQSWFNGLVCGRWGADAGLGIHHTWQGESGTNDFPAGVADYFTLTRCMSAGYVDGVWWDDREVAYTLSLASGLGKHAHGGLAFSNCYNWGTSRREQAYQTRLMALHRVDWTSFNYADECDGPSTYPLGRAWQEHVDGVARLDRVSAFLGGARTRPEVAVWHGWEGVARLNEPGTANFWKTFVMNTAWQLQEHSVEFDFVCSEDLAAGHPTADGVLETAAGSYGTIVMGYAAMLPPAVWDVLGRFAAASGELVFVGPPPSCTTTGEPLADAFARLAGVRPVELGDWLAHLRRALPTPRQVQLRVDHQYPLAADGARLLVDVEGTAYGASRGSVHWLTELDPQEKLVALLRSVGRRSPWVSVRLEDGIAQRYEREDGTRFLALLARPRRRMSGAARTGRDEVTVAGEGMVVLRVEDGRFVEALGEELETLERGGRPMAWTPIGAGPRVERTRWTVAPRGPYRTTLLQ